MDKINYQINKGINASIEFKGLKAQYIWYLGGAFVILLIVFAILYMIGVNTYICLALILVCGGGVTLKIYKMSNTYGEYGMMKKVARRRVPKVLKSYNRTMFISLKKHHE